MTNDIQKELATFKSLEEVSSAVLKSIANVFQVNTVYIAKKEKDHMDVKEVYNRKHLMVDKGLKVNYKESYCQFVMENSESTFQSINLSADTRTAHVKLAGELGFKTFLGASLIDKDGKEYGTLCLIDDNEKTLSDDEISLFKTIASLLGYLISLDQAENRMEMLSTPIVPLIKGVVVLPLIGVFDTNRTDSLTKNILHYCSENQLEYFLIDLSGIATIDDSFFNHFIGITQSLQLMGIQSIITGVRPDIAAGNELAYGLTKSDVQIKANVELALDEIGFKRNL